MKKKKEIITPVIISAPISPFDEDMAARVKEHFVRTLTEQITATATDKFETLYPSATIINASNLAPIEEKELRMLFDVLCEKERERRGIAPVKPTVSINDLDLMFTIKDDKKTYILNTENMCRVLRKHTDLAGKFRYDNFQNTFEVYDRARWRTQEDHDIIDTQTFISFVLPVFARISKDMVRDAIMKVSKENEVDTASDYMRSLVWDNTARLDTWLTSVYGVEENEYHKKVGANWLKGMVKRIVFPGCKFDYVLVLEGEQGVKKSTSLAMLGGAWHTETTMSTDTKDFFMQFAGKSIIEFSEGETLSRTEVKRMKAIITMQSDRYRMPYERATLDFPRRCVFAMTTNQTEYLKDETGNRRWLPVAVVLPEADIAWLEANREQLFAEAYYRVVTLKETLYEFPKEDMEREQSARMIHDPNADVIAEWYLTQVGILDKEAGVTIHQVFTEVLHPNGTMKSLDKYSEMMIAEVLHNQLKLQKRRVLKDGVQRWRWFPLIASTPSEFEAARKAEQEQIF